MTQGRLFLDRPVIDRREARNRTDVAVSRVRQGASSAFLLAASEAIVKVARVQATFICDDVWQALSGSGVQTQDNRALGAAMRAAVRDGVIEPTAEFRPSAQVQCHSNPRRVWRSRVYSCSAFSVGGMR